MDNHMVYHYSALRWSIRMNYKKYIDIFYRLSRLVYRSVVQPVFPDLSFKL
jgi:hypothetical protein